MTIVLTGGGSGGHITPILAVAAELKRLDNKITVVYIGQRGDGLADVPASDPNINKVYTVRAGKFRRYSGEGWRQLLDLKTQALNLRDGFWVLVGLWQSFKLLRKLNADIIFTRGGFVSVPVALGGKLNGTPYITHDSDSIPSLSNRIIAHWATLHAVALPPETYPYSSSKIRVVGIPVSDNYQLVTSRLKRHYRKLLRLDKANPVLLVTGGGNGAEKLNSQVINNAKELMKKFDNLSILHITGRTQEDKVRQAYKKTLTKDELNRVVVEGFVRDLYRYSGAADLVIARGGATNLAEFAIQAKPCLLIPSPQLVWNEKNAEVMEKHRAVVRLSDAQADQELRLTSVVSELFLSHDKLAELSKRINQLAHPGSATEVAQLLVDQVDQVDKRN